MNEWQVCADLFPSLTDRNVSEPARRQGPGKRHCRPTMLSIDRRRKPGNMARNGRRGDRNRPD